MTARLPLTRTVQVATRADGAVNETNDPTYTYGAWVTYKGELQMAQSSEQTVNRDTAVSDWFLWLPPDATIDFNSRVLCDGVTYEVVGQPEHVWHPWARKVAHIYARLKAVTG